MSGCKENLVLQCCYKYYFWKICTFSPSQLRIFCAPSWVKFAIWWPGVPSRWIFSQLGDWRYTSTNMIFWCNVHANENINRHFNSSLSCRNRLWYLKSLNVFIHVSVPWEFASWPHAKSPRQHMTWKGVPYSWEISQPDGNDEGTDISRYCSSGAPDCWCSILMFWLKQNHTCNETTCD